jgi:hypothetical protein
VSLALTRSLRYAAADNGKNKFVTTPDTRLRTYFKAFWNDWLSRMCGPLSVPLAVIAVFWKDAPVKELWGVLAVVAFFVASYRVWRNERKIRLNELEESQQTARAEIAGLNEKNAALSESIQNLAKNLADKTHELKKQVDAGIVKQKQDLIRALTVLRTMELKVRYWHDITDGKWGMSPPVESIVPNEMHHFLYLAERVKPNLRVELENIRGKLQQAESCIREFKSQPAAFQQERLMRQAHTQLNEAAPSLSHVIAEIESFEKGLT